MSGDASLYKASIADQAILINEEIIMSEDESDDSEIDRAEFGLYQCLPVDDGAPNFQSDEPLTVEEYLRRVRYEASMLPSVTRSSVPVETKEAPSLKQGVLGSDLVQCDSGRKPSVVWVRSFLSHFVSLRNLLEQLRLHGQPAWQCGISESDLPGIEALLPLGQVELQDMLERHMSKMRKSDHIDKETFTLFYLISALLELPCHPDVLAIIRNLARYCADIRAREPCPEMEELSMANILITICGGLFKQDEELAVMWDEEMFSLP
jgi:hypothetical protein